MKKALTKLIGERLNETFENDPQKYVFVYDKPYLKTESHQSHNYSPPTGICIIFSVINDG